MPGSRLWLIPAVLLVTAALAGLGTWLTAGGVEANLASRSQAALAGAGLAGGQVTFDGRDATLRGFPADKTEQAVDAVRAVDGVRVVKVDAAPAPSTSPAAPSTSRPVPSPALTTSPPPADKPSLQAEINRMLAAGPITFAPGSARLTDAGERAAVQVAGLIAGSPVTSKIEVDGHAARASGDRQSALKLSEDRATAVAKLLVKNGVPASRVSAKGYGDTRPGPDGEDRRADVTIR
jgi:outer membrane protein OmpA-like peptidoglycan-associated protein